MNPQRPKTLDHKHNISRKKSNLSCFAGSISRSCLSLIILAVYKKSIHNTTIHHHLLTVYNNACNLCIFARI